MLTKLTEAVLNYKAGLMTAGSGLLVWIVDLLSWFNSNLTHFAAIASFFLVVTMIVAHFLSMVRENKKLKLDVRLTEIEMENRKLDSELKRIQIKATQNRSEQENGDSTSK